MAVCAVQAFLFAWVMLLDSGVPIDVRTHLLLKTNSYSKAALHYSKKKGTIIGRIVLWLAVWAAAIILETDSFSYTIIIPTLAGTSLTIIYTLFE